LGELVGSYANMVNQGGQIKLLHADNKWPMSCGQRSSR
jgi:hypothetical protein